MLKVLQTKGSSDVKGSSGYRFFKLKVLQMLKVLQTTGSSN